MRFPLHVRILIGAAIGAALGSLAAATLAGTPTLEFVTRYIAVPMGQVFLRLLFMLVLPLVFSALVLGISEMGDLRKLGRVGLKTLAYTVVVSAIAVVLGLTLVNVMRPGDGLSPDLQARLSQGSEERIAGLTSAKKPATGLELLLQIIPNNPLKAAADGDMLAWMFFAAMIGIGLCMTQTPATSVFRTAIGGLFDVSMRLIGFVITLAPFGVGALLFGLTADLGWEILKQLASYVFVVVLALAIHQFVVYSLAVKLLGGMSPVAFFRAVQAAMITAFSTASSNATLPTSIKVAEENLKLPPRIARFVLTLGSTANQNGTALFEGVTVLFLAQFYGVSLSMSQQLLVLVVCILGGIGTAGVPAGSLPVVVLIMGMVGVPVEGIGLILGVDRFLDMCRTTLNVTGDLAAAVVVSKGEAAEPARAPAPGLAT
jgi:DAACS family dicarboxylate/amino acid:cation (Na+ or H+) symporter